MSLLRHRRSILKKILLWTCLLIPASAFLYSTNGHVRGLEKRLEAATAQIVAEKESLRVLRAEWAFLNSPRRLAAASEKYLDESGAPAAAQVVALNLLPSKLAPRGEARTAAGRLTIEPGAQAGPVLARPVSFSATGLSALHRDKAARLPASAGWSKKLAATPPSETVRRSP